ncbi:MAG: hypothetical protein U5N26_00645 [Candidatus Marinimicrobia bacterium]|nr:hypothetical protein [Candidatus Neomarinimicrobiota bacterium]
MFVWQAKMIIEKINRFLPELGACLNDISESIGTPDYPETVAKKWKTIQPISIDYGVLEQACRINVVKARFDWSDVGSWDTIYKLEKRTRTETPCAQRDSSCVQAATTYTAKT